MSIAISKILADLEKQLEKELIENKWFRDWWSDSEKKIIELKEAINELKEYQENLP